MDDSLTFAGGTRQRTLIVLNPAAGQDDPARLRRALGGALTALGVSFDLVETRGEGDAARFAREAARSGYRAVVAVGGDGTVAEVITGVAGTATPVGIIPRGTGNQLAFNLGIPRGVERGAAIIAHGVAAPMDVGRLEDGRYFALAAGAGFDAEIVARATRERKDRWGFGAYLFAGISVGFFPSASRFHIIADGEPLEVDAAMVLAANVGSFVSPYLPLAVQIGPRVSYSDGLLDLCIFAPRTRTGLAAVLWRVAMRRYTGDERMIFLRARTLEIAADPPVVTQVDGELLGHTPLRLESIPAGVHVLVPGAACG